jgi:hypothetical protein
MRKEIENFKYHTSGVQTEFENIIDQLADFENKNLELKGELVDKNQGIESLKARLFDLGESANA